MLQVHAAPKKIIAVPKTCIYERSTMTGRENFARSTCMSVNLVTFV